MRLCKIKKNKLFVTEIAFTNKNLLFTFMKMSLFEVLLTESNPPAGMQKCFCKY